MESKGKAAAGRQLTSLQEDWKHIRYLIIDETMVGLGLALTDKRLREIFPHRNVWFGGLIVIVCGAFGLNLSGLYLAKKSMLRISALHTCHGAMQKLRPKPPPPTTAADRLNSLWFLDTSLRPSVSLQPSRYLPVSLELSIHALKPILDTKVMLTRNLWVDQGLTNGSMGQVHEISLDGVARPRVDMPSSVAYLGSNHPG
ncbi:hypothetical protein C362_00194 [Cryptococcus neoformans Bt1]|nr:hypothetical protein C362_00194 [Cryptococcus neoformans var. grubii Bt1]OXC66914.1 hypothetical protein AYX13_04562 [Cryptococcus neoformans var. grubii]